MTKEGSSPSPERSETRRLAPWLWVCLALLLLAASAEVAGILLRDRLEGRRVALPQAPEATLQQPEAAGAPAPSASSRFGPEVREVAIAPPAPVPAPLERTPTSLARTEPPGAEAKPAEAPTPRSEPPTEASKARAVSSGAYVLDVDTFLSQRYLRETEATLSSLGIPYFRREITRKGKGQRLFVSTPDDAARQKTLKVLEANHYLYRDTDQGLELYFYFRYEVEAASSKLSGEGIQTSASPVDGDRPFWMLYAGPFSEEDALSAQGRLADLGVQTRLRQKR